MLKRICKSIARISFSGAMLGRPLLDVGLVHPREQLVHLGQRLIDHQPDAAQRMSGWHEVVQPA